ncbi:MAG: recombinase family protein, partial [Oscillospiraceae bacterium]|nr:recombinase family protein [Oscillospiraceae bacterium]
YNKLKQHEGIILKPALTQLKELNTALQRGNPAMLAVNKAIAETSEQSYKISQLQSRGLLDADACAAKLAALDAQVTQLRVKRRRLLKNDDISEAVEALRQTVDTLHQGPERLDEFHEELFANLVEQVVVDSSHGLRFRLNGGFEVTERLREGER